MKVIDMKKIQRSSFKLNPVAAAIALAMASQLTASVAYANAGFGPNTNIAGNQIAVPTYYANSPQGVQVALDPVTHLPVLNAAKKPATVADILATINPATNAPYTVAEALAAGKLVDTGAAMRKFVDPLAGAYYGVDGLPTAGVAMGIPVAITEKWVDSNGKVTGDDYYEVAAVEYLEQMHSDLAKPTRLRGYVQIETANILNNKLKDITGAVGSEHIPGKYVDGSPILDKNGNQVFFVHAPHYLGPTILVARGTAVRMVMHNYLPYTDAAGVSHGAVTKDALGNGINGGEFPLPVDETIAGGGPIFDINGKPLNDVNGKPIKYSQNRIAIHWHGGDAPWISDGTPHQWFAPAGDVSYSIVDATHPKGMGVGDSYQNVPDMPDPGQGAQTLYYPNNLSGRLMMYHDHVSGLTKLNAYTGEAAGYLVYDMTELGLASKALGTPIGSTTTLASGPLTGVTLPTGLLDAVGIPLVIQDKSFVPKNVGANPVNSANLPVQSQDTKWDLAHWGQEGDLYFPHVYETNQDPNSIDGTNPVGRWDWGPWFWPVFPSQYSLPTGAYGDVSATPEAFMDTPTVNGQAYPTLTVDPKTYRFRILSIANDRTFNFGLYQAVDANGVVCDAITNPNPAPYPVAPGQLGAPATCTEVKMVPAVPTASFPANWPTDGRAGGVPDPATAGPDIVQIGSEGGLLPAPAVWKSQPVAYDYNVRNITVFNVLQHDLLMGGGERADVLIDFTKYAGKTLIVYNDAPAPMPGYDPRIDYFTGMGDHTEVGGAYDVLPGYGPNTRTVMQIKVNANNTSGTGGPLNVAALAAAMPAAYAATQPEPLIPQIAYNAPFGTNNVNNYAAIGTGSIATNGVYTFTVPPYTDAAGVVQTTKTIPVINKAIQELFDPVYGRMNSTLAVELPFSSATIATTIPLAYIDGPVERLDAIKDGETQIWKVTHNGVDDHPVHFHMVNVQVINRVGWDGTIKPPEANEVGWKETLRMNPLEDVYVAVKAVHPVVPFGLPQSNRLLDPSQAAGSTMGFTQVNPSTGQAPAAPYSNVTANFDNEYVWHCHILGHEEFDFMRPFIFHPNVTVPDAPAAVTLNGTTVTWTDTTPFGGQDAQGVPTAGANAAYPVPTSSTKNEIGFKIQESVNGGAFNTIVSVPANTTSWAGANPANAYQVVAYNAAGDSLPGTAITTTNAGVLSGAAVVVIPVSGAAPTVAGPAGPSGLTTMLNADGSVTLNWTAIAGATGYQVSVNGAAPVLVTGATTYIVPKANLIAGALNTFSVAADTLSGPTAPVTASLYTGAAAVPVVFTASQGMGVPGSVTLNWANNPLNVNNVTSLTLSWTLLGGGALTTNGSITFAPNIAGATVINLSRDKDYSFKLQANSNAGNSAVVTVRGLSAP